MNSMIEETLGIDPECSNPEPDEEPVSLHHPFRLPITYLPSSDLHELSTIVSDDLELVNTKSKRSIYEELFRPSNQFGTNMISEWEKHFTSNTTYLSETQCVIGESELEDGCEDTDTVQDYESMMEIWDDIKGNRPHFIEKYCYIEWDTLKSLNRSSSFMQIISIINMMSPAISLLIPFIFLIFPFVILKMRGISISVTVYLDVLKDIAKHHFIGKTILTLSAITPEKIIYLVMCLGMYCYQIYMNIIACKRFYNNVGKVSLNLYNMKGYITRVIRHMNTYIVKHKSKSTYTEFCKDIQTHIDTLHHIMGLLEPHTNPEFALSTIGNVGYLLKSYYELHSNYQYEQALRYSFGFEGYLDNIRGVRYHMNQGRISNAKFSDEDACKFKDQCYPFHTEMENCVKNTCNLNKKIIITGPNASGKTTMLKMTTINVIFSQQIGCGYYKSCVINPYTHIHSYLNIPDTSERDSLFQAESRRCKDIIDIIVANKHENGCRHYGIFDELYSGTNPLEATKAGYAFLKYLSKYPNVDFILTTHYTQICSKLRKNENIQSYKMDVIEKQDGGLEYSYKMKKGVSKIQGAINILQDMDYPSEIIEDVKNYTNKTTTVYGANIRKVSDELASENK